MCFDAFLDHQNQVLKKLFASVPDAYAQHVLKRLRSVHVLVPDAMLSARNSS
jgi:hypothetical protein